MLSPISFGFNLSGGVLPELAAVCLAAGNTAIKEDVMGSFCEKRLGLDANADWFFTFEILGFTFEGWNRYSYS